jgi:lipopolysaccharide export system permease protein
VRRAGLEAGEYSTGSVMSRLNRYVFRQLFWITVLVLASLTCVAWLTQSLRFVELIVNRGLSVPLFVYFTALLLPSLLSIILPVAVFIAVAFTYNRLIVDSELVAMRATGLSQRRLAMPAILLALACTAFGYVLSLWLLPASYRQFKDTQFEIRDTYTSVLLQEGVFTTLMKGVTVYVRDRAPDGELLGIIVQDGRDRQHSATMMAERGALVEGPDGPRVLMIKGNRQEMDVKTGRMSILYFDRYVFDVGTASAAPQTRWREPRERYLGELFLPRGQGDKTWSYNKLRMEGHSRLAGPLLSLAVALVALACLLTGEFDRRGQGRRIAFAVVLVVGIEGGALVLKSVGEKYLAAAPLLYADPIVPILVAALALAVTGRRRRRRGMPAAQPAG